jgi:hypothetical protein
MDQHSVSGCIEFVVSFSIIGGLDPTREVNQVRVFAEEVGKAVQLVRDRYAESGRRVLILGVGKYSEFNINGSEVEQF